MAIFESEDILQTARAVRPYLEVLLDEEADETGRELDQLIDRATAGEDVDILILETLRKHSATRNWMKQALRPELDIMRKYNPQPGDPRRVPATRRFACPVRGCGFVWVRRHVGLGVPPCPDHNEELVPADQ